MSQGISSHPSRARKSTWQGIYNIYIYVYIYIYLYLSICIGITGVWGLGCLRHQYTIKDHKRGPRNSNGKSGRLAEESLKGTGSF